MTPIRVLDRRCMYGKSAPQATLEHNEPRLADLRPDVILWITSMVEGAAAAHARVAKRR